MNEKKTAFLGQCDSYPAIHESEKTASCKQNKSVTETDRFFKEVFLEIFNEHMESSYLYEPEEHNISEFLEKLSIPFLKSANQKASICHNQEEENHA